MGQVIFEVVGWDGGGVTWAKFKGVGTRTEEGRVREVGWAEGLGNSAKGKLLS